MALTLKDLISAQEALREKEEQAAAPKESMSMDQLKELVMASGGEKKTKTDNSLVKIYQEVKRQTKLLEQLVTISKDQSVLNSRENLQENRRLMERVANALDGIEQNTKEKPGPEKEKTGGIGIGGLATALALGLGAIVGTIQGYVKGLKVVSSSLYKGLIWVSDFFPSLKKALFNIEATLLLGFDLIKDSFKTFVGKLTKTFDLAVDFVKGFFTGGDKMAGVAKVFAEAKAGVINWFAPISEAFKVIREASAPIGKAVDFITESVGKMMTFFSEVGSKLSIFGKVAKATANIFKAIVWPLTVLMTGFDVIMNVIDRFKSDGIIGAFVGVFEGLFTSIVAAPADLLKDIVSWVLGVFGFENAEKFLDSFSFVDIVKGFVDAILHPVETIKELFNGAVSALQEIHIPEISFTIPIIDKKVSIGPFYPFKTDSTAPATAPAGAPTAPGASPAATSPAATGTKEGYKQSYDAAVSEGKSPFAAKMIADKEHGLTGTGKSPSTLPAAGEVVPAPASPAGTAPMLITNPEQVAVPNNAAPILSTSPTAANVQNETNVTNNTTTDNLQSTASSVLNKVVSNKTEIMNRLGLGVVARSVGNLVGSIASPLMSGDVVKQPTNEAGAVYQQSADNAGASIPSSTPASTVVAPTTNISNTTQNQVIRMPVRNTDTSVMDYFKSRYA